MCHSCSRRGSICSRGTCSGVIRQDGKVTIENKNSMFPDGALLEIGTPKRPDIKHGSCAQGGNMRNLLIGGNKNG